MCEPLNHIHQDTKSARLIVVCKRRIKGVPYRFQLFTRDHVRDHVRDLRTRTFLSLKYRQKFTTKVI